ncbi:MAG: DUF481 domain-containing protein [Steroidobacteraceae bacterium]
MRSSAIEVFLLGLSALPVVAHAEWLGRGEAGVAFASSNASTKTNTFNAKFELANQLDRWKHAFGASAVYASSRDENNVRALTSNRWEAHEQSDFNFREGGFWFENLRYESDEVGSFEYQAAATSGVGYKFFDTDDIKISVQVGAGYKAFRQRVVAPEVSEAEHDVIGSAAFDYQQSMTVNTSLSEKLAVEVGETNTSAQNDLVLQVKMSDVLALALGWQLRFNSNPGMRTSTAAYERYDRLTTANFVYEFK